MTINRLQLTSSTLFDQEFKITQPICIIQGTYSELILDLIRESICDYGAISSPDRIEDGRFVIHEDIDMDSKNYSLCYIRNADFMGDNRIAANFDQSSIKFSTDDTEEFLTKCSKLNSDGNNVFFEKVLPTDLVNSETEHRIASFERFIKSNSPNDMRPMFIYGFFDRIDSGIDIAPYLDTLSSLNKQIFISVCKGYPANKTEHTDVQYVSVP